ncbi:MAG TPA: Hpt domain-containing protein [Bryobacteraceae bacterium]|jgi:histidine phosphotransfer protein HptB|nr:Hpt domain-containing protein [Bryobacteraceae bacterium]
MAHEKGSPAGKAIILVHPPDGLPYKAVATYLDNCRNGLQPLNDAINRLDYDFARVYGHRMKGCGSAYGFPALTETGASIEQAACARNDDDLRTCAATLQAHLESFEVVEPLTSSG